MKLFKEFVEKKEVNVLFSNLFSARDHAHKLHLATKSYSEHKALGNFYEDLLPLVDQIIETYQGEYDLVNLKNSTVKYPEEPTAFLTKFADDIKNSRKMFDGDDHIQNIIDEITSLAFQTLYKLRFLK